MDNKDDLWRQGAYFVHSISTPIATLQLNLGVLAEYLPVLVEHYGKSSSDGDPAPAIPPEMLVALQKLTEPMQQCVTTLQQRTQDFSYQLQLHNSREAPEDTKQAQSVHQTSVDAKKTGDAQAVGTGHSTRDDITGTARRIQKILVVEDEEIHQQVTVKQLKGLCQVDVASSGSEAMQKWQSQAYDLVLMDFLLPGMSGPKVLQGMAETDKQPPVVIGFTNLPDIPDEYSSTAIPVTAYLSKPFKLANFEALLARLNLALAREI